MTSHQHARLTRSTAAALILLALALQACSSETRTSIFRAFDGGAAPTKDFRPATTPPAASPPADQPR